MAVPYIKVSYAKEGTSSYTEITQAIKWDVKHGLDIKNSTVTIPIKNSYKDLLNTGSSKRYQGKIDNGDLIKIWADWEPITESSDQLLLYGEVNKINLQFDQKKNQISITAVDRTALILNSVWSGQYDATDNALSAPEIIKLIIEFTHKDKFTFNNMVTNSGQGWGTETGRPDGTNFPDISFSSNMKPLYELIEELSGIENTNSDTELENGTNPVKRTMIFYVDEDNDVHWEYPKDVANDALVDGSLNDSATTIPTTGSTSDYSSSGIISIENEQIKYTGKTSSSFTGCTRGYNNTTASSHSSTRIYEALAFSVGVKPYITSSKFTKSIFDVINMIIFRLGKDLKGNSYMWYAYNPAAEMSNLKIKVMDWGYLSDTVKASYYGMQTTLDGAVAVGDTTITLTSVSDGGESFTNPGTALIIGQDGSEIITYTGISSNDLTGVTRAQYGTPAMAFEDDAVIIDITTLMNLDNDDFKTTLRNKGTAKAMAILRRFGNARWKGSFEIIGNKISPGEIVKLSILDVGLNGAELRVHDVQHNLTKAGWFTTLQVEEDEEIIEKLLGD